MKKMPKILSGALALALVACMGTTAFAAGPDANAEGTNIDQLNGNETIDVQLNADITETEPTYSVNVAWTSMKFTYTGTEDSDWNVGTHKYDTTGTGSWDSQAGTVTVTNHSDVAVGLTGAYKSTTGYENGTAKDGVTVTYTDFDQSKLEAATEASASTPGNTQDTASIAIAGTPLGDLSAVTAGTITVTISTATD